MRLGINLPSRHADGTPLSAQQTLTRAREIEEAGFDGIWIGDTVHRGHHVSPDPLLWLLAASTATKHIELGVSVLQVPLREPFELAQRLVTMNVLTGGRFCLGVGAGSTRADFQALGVNFDDRFKLLSEYLPILRQLCNGEQVGSASLRPWALPGAGPRMLIGAWASGPWVLRAAREYDGWLASGAHARGLKGLADGIKRYRDAGGKRALVATVRVDLSAPRRPLAQDGPFELICGPEEAADRLGILADLGYDDALLAKPIDQTSQDLIDMRALLPRHDGQ
jgi:alkanesulfonate monooxygenase SsuD/methylene tetrahydromethanopterin reductase-like flavin-dependent oxidoreductase (luciferase family)